MVCKFVNGRETESEKPVAGCSKKSMRNSPQAICNPHVECYELSTAVEIREIPIGKIKASFPESIWSSNMEIINNDLPQFGPLHELPDKWHLSPIIFD